MTITVSANNARVRYTATSSQTAFAVPFEFTDNDEISVFVATTATNEAGAEKTQGTGSTHYAISGGGGATGTVTFVTGITQGHIVTIVRDIPVERTTDFTAGTTINRAALNTQLDNMTAMIGDLKDRTDRSIRLSDSDTENSLLLPSIDNRAGKIFGFNSSGGLTADTAANFDITLDDVLSNTITITGNPNSKFLVSTALDSHLKSVGGVLNLQSQKGSNTAGISLDGSASVGIDISAGNKTIRIQDATNFTSTVDIDGALNVDGAAIIDGTLGAGASTLSSVITNTITSLASADIDIKPLGGQVNILNAAGAQRLLFDNADQPFITYFQSSNITKLGVVDPTATRNILLPNASDTLVGKATTDTLTNKTLTSPVLNTGVSGSAFLDEDNMGSNSATKVASQQSIKAYVDSVAGGATFSALLSSGNTTGGTDIVVSANDDITFTDSSKAIFGAGGDLKIHHDASNSYITESGTGGLFIESSTVRINTGTLFVNNAANDENLFKAVQNFGVTLYYNNAIKIATTNTGIAVTGEVAATTLDISGAIDVAGTTNLDVVDIDGAVNMATTALVTGVLTTTATQVATGGITSGSNIVSDTDSTDDLGTTSVRWANLFVDGITATDQITATGFTGTLDGVLGGGTAAAANITALDTSAAVNLNLTTDSTSSTSGALIVDGGVGIAKKLFVGTDLDVDGTTNLDATNIVGATDINGLLHISPNTSGKDTFELSTSASNEARLRMKNVDTLAVEIRAGGASYFNGGNVGLGVTSPAAALHIDAIDNGAIVAIFDTDNSASKLIFRNTSTTGNNTQIGAVGNDFAAFTGGAERMRISAAGAVQLAATATTSAIIGRSVIPNGSNGLTLTASVVSTLPSTTPAIADNTSTGASLFLAGRSTDAYGGNIVLQAYGSGSATTGNQISFNNRSGAGTTKEVMNINSAGDVKVNVGNLVIGTAGKGIDFHNFGSGATIGSNLLDDYEEGVWTPAIKHGSTAATMTDLGASGSYTKVGRMVTLMGNAKVAGVNGNGAVTMTGFPFTVADTVAVTGVEASGTISYYASWGAVVNSLVITASAGNTTGEMYGNHNTSGMNSTAEAITQVELNANAEFRFSITYFST
mgnify:CR=1 FL=1